MIYYESNYICHYGLKGMKWGQRRWQNEDGTFNEAGKARYFSKSSSHRPISVMKLQNDPDVQKRKAELKQAKVAKDKAYKAYNKASAGGLMTDEKEKKALIRADNAIRFAKQDLSDEKARKRMESDVRPKSKRRLKLEEEYKAKGMTAEEAELAAYKRARTEKALKIAAGIAVTAAVAYGASKYVENNVDRVIKSDVSFKRVATSDTAGVQDAFYATFGNKKMDNAKYAGLYAKQLKAGTYGTAAKNVYEKTINAKESFKMASTKSAKGALQELMSNDPEFKKAFSDQFRFNPAMQKAIQSGKVDKSVYEYFNQQLGASAKNSDVAKRYYDALSKKGYNAIMDVNDKKFSGFGTNMPVIIFNAKDKVNVSNVRELSDSEINKKNALVTLDIGAKAMAPNLAKFGAVTAGIVGVSKASQSKKEQQIVADYKKEHPNSKLSYKDIVRNYYNQ